MLPSRNKETKMNVWLILMLLCALEGQKVDGEFKSLEPETFDQRLNEAERILQIVPLIDGQNDLAMSLHDLVNNRLKLFPFKKNLTTVHPWALDGYSHTDLPRLQEGMVSAEFWSAWVPCNLPATDLVIEGLAQVDVIKRLIDKYPDDMEFVDSSEGILKAFEAGRIASLINIDGGHMINNSLAVLRTYYNAGARYMTLTHDCNTAWAESCCSEHDDTNKVKGLTDFGQLVIGEMNRLGMIVDLTDASEQTMNDVLDVTAAPAIFSHAAAKALCNYSANVPDDILLRVKENAGIIMVTFDALILACSTNSTIHDVIDHINYIRNITGVDHIGIGSNFNGFDEITQGLEDVSKFPYLFAELLLDPSWTQKDLEKLAGRNFLRVFELVESVKEVLSSERPIEGLFEK